MDDNGMSDMFHSIAASFKARSLAIALSGVQAEHYKQLIAEGVNQDAAILITTQTSQAMLDAATNVIKVIVENSAQLTSAFNLLNENR